MVHDHEKETLNNKTNETKAEAARIEAEAKKLAAEADRYRAESERLAAGNGGAAAAGSRLDGHKERRAPMKCPVVEENCTESDWSFLVAEWTRYSTAVGLDGDEPGAVRHLWAACSDRLRRALHNDGAQSETAVLQLLQRVKSLAVKRRNNLVNMMTLQKMGQQREEGVLSFLSRLNGQADLCDLQVACACSKSVCFKEKFKTLQLIRGLVDQEIQERVLAAGAALSEGAELSLAEVVKLVEAAESARSTRDLVSGAGGLNRLSDHQKYKGQRRQDKGKPSAQQGGAQGKCGFCGRKSHTRDNCPAKDALCNSCKRKGHFSVQCRTKGKSGNTSKGVKEVKEAGEELLEPGAGVRELTEIEEDFFGGCMRISVAPGESSPMPTGLSSPRAKVAGLVGSQQRPITHHRCDDLGRWTRGRVEPHGRIRLRLTVEESVTR